MNIRFIVVGTGNRGLGCFAKGLLGFPNKGLPEFPERADLVALVDTNLLRGKAAARELNRPDMPVFRTVTEAQRQVPADWCIVTVTDKEHRDVVIESLNAGLNVLVDKPLATSVMECDEIIAAMNRTGLKVIVGHNLRYQRWALKAAKLLREGVIGEVISAEVAELLSYSHGGDYFHRWHSDFSKSAGLMNHKCCHHIDLLCWMINDDPIEVSSRGGRRFYTPRPDLKHGARCGDCAITASCPHFFDMNKWDGVYRRIYKEAEGEDGYVRDLCVFSDRHTVYDHQTLQIRFAKGSLAAFSMNMFSPREGCYFYITGTKGRLEVGENLADHKPFLRVLDYQGKLTEVNVELDAVDHEHGHGGADIRLIADRLGLGESDPLQVATTAEARRAVLIADLASRSVAAGGIPVTPSAAGHDFPPPPPQ